MLPIPAYTRDNNAWTGIPVLIDRGSKAAAVVDDVEIRTGKAAEATGGMEEARPRAGHSPPVHA
ncbi:MAG: hypothetical protein ACE5OQ_10530 [Woeseia sp.]